MSENQPFKTGQEIGVRKNMKRVKSFKAWRWGKEKDTKTAYLWVASDYIVIMWRSGLPSSVLRGLANGEGAKEASL